MLNAPIHFIQSCPARKPCFERATARRTTSNSPASQTPVAGPGEAVVKVIVTI
jgi:hypothetical protein